MGIDEEKHEMWYPTDELFFVFASVLAVFCL